MSKGQNKNKLVTVEKDGQQGEVSPVQLAGLEKHGWTVVDDGNSESGQASAPANHEE